jgi:hypothetical protein
LSIFVCSTHAARAVRPIGVEPRQNGQWQDRDQVISAIERGSSLRRACENAPSGPFGQMIFRVQFLDGSARVIAQWSA